MNTKKYEVSYCTTVYMYNNKLCTQIFLTIHMYIRFISRCCLHRILLVLCSVQKNQGTSDF